MTSEYIFNRNKADELAQEAEMINVNTQETVEGIAAIANTYATLALAEQLRIGNLIRWTTQDGSQPDRLLTQEIEDGLGI